MCVFSEKMHLNLFDILFNVDVFLWTQVAMCKFECCKVHMKSYNLSISTVTLKKNLKCMHRGAGASLSSQQKAGYSWHLVFMVSFSTIAPIADQ